MQFSPRIPVRLIFSTIQEFHLNVQVFSHLKSSHTVIATPWPVLEAGRWRSRKV